MNTLSFLIWKTRFYFILTLLVKYHVHFHLWVQPNPTHCHPYICEIFYGAQFVGIRSSACRPPEIGRLYNGKGTSVNSHYPFQLHLPLLLTPPTAIETKGNPQSRFPLRFGKKRFLRSVTCMDSRCRCTSSSSSISISQPSDQLLLQSRSSSPSSAVRSTPWFRELWVRVSE